VQYFEPFDDGSWPALQEAAAAHGRFPGGRTGVLTDPARVPVDG
jgi:hypothetical protein